MTKKQETYTQDLLTVAHHDFSKGLNARAFFKVNDRAVSQDLVQDTFLKTWKYLIKGGKIEIMKSFLYHILNNLIIDEYRKNKTTSLDVMVEKGFSPRDEESDRVINILDAKLLMPLIKRLPIAYQKVMRMRHVQDLSLKEMSLITGQTKNSLAVRLHRGLGKLKSLYRVS